MCGHPGMHSQSALGPRPTKHTRMTHAHPHTPVLSPKHENIKRLKLNLSDFTKIHASSVFELPKHDPMVMLTRASAHVRLGYACIPIKTLNSGFGTPVLPLR